MFEIESNTENGLSDVGLQGKASQEIKVYVRVYQAYERTGDEILSQQGCVSRGTD